MSGTVTLVWTANATGALTATQLAAQMAAKWAAMDHSLITVLYDCTIASAVATHALNVATFTVVIDISPVFIRMFPNTPPDLTPFYDLYSAEFLSGILQPVNAQTPVYSAP
ncbi:MAG: hypothetical protein ACYDDA_05175 [Acidiferrobacteraceae bacterium]